MRRENPLRVRALQLPTNCSSSWSTEEATSSSSFEQLGDMVAARGGESQDGLGDNTTDRRRSCGV